MTAAIEPHPALAPLLAFIGTWEGEGEGEYPTIAPFRYRERLSFEQVGKPFLTYEQRTWSVTNGAPMHRECGYLRIIPDTSPPVVEFIIAQPTGIAEVAEGTLADGVVDVSTTTTGCTATAVPVSGVRRRLWLEDAALHYELSMATPGTIDARHLAARLDRIDRP